MDQMDQMGLHPSSIIIHHPSSSIIDVQNFPPGLPIIAPNGAPRLADIAPLSMQTIQEFLVLRLRTCSFGGTVGLTVFLPQNMPPTTHQQ